MNADVIRAQKDYLEQVFNKIEKLAQKKSSTGSGGKPDRASFESVQNPCQPARKNMPNACAMACIIITPGITIHPAILPARSRIFL